MICNRCYLCENDLLKQLTEEVEVKNILVIFSGVPFFSSEVILQPKAKIVSHFHVTLCICRYILFSCLVDIWILMFTVVLAGYKI